ncbi:MAG TPA: Asp-tRNA(Asn)/Glu-tRNA(Gln) amidotransferase subunit GatB [Bacilli bacterium]|nr:Asp-tRNA(Asn)/Glu-tRNA(Gln) amidotransferase subunit GatB [Bacilli bacterium]
MKYEAIIGLELHVALKTKTKMFSRSAVTFDEIPNTHVTATDLGYSGSFPRINKKAVQNAIMLAHALNMEIDNELHFDRKNYFYSDLPKGYQITQDRRPIGKNGHLTITTNDSSQVINIERIHLEEDTAKQIHLDDETLVDFNRAGVPLIEIVTKPDLRSGEEASEFIEMIREIVTYLDISDGKMEEGSLRCDVNISLRPVGTKEFGVKVEIKNLNSISNVARVIDYEIIRQTELLNSNETIVEETRRYDDDLRKSVSMRLKGEDADYKYFPEGNIVPIKLSDKFIAETIKEMAELPTVKRTRYLDEFKLTPHDIKLLVGNKELALYYDELTKLTKHYKLAAHWVNGEISAYLNKTGISINEMALKITNVAKLLELIASDKISNNQARELFNVIVVTNEDPEQKAQELNLLQVSDEAFILEVINEVLTENKEAIYDIKNGKDRAFGFLVGQVMKRTKGKVNPALASKLMREEINKH